MPVQAVALLLRPFFSREMLVDIPPLAMACAAASRWYVRLHTKPSLLWCANLHTKPSLSSLVCQLTHKTLSLFSGMPTYTQNPLSLLWCANLHTKPPLSSPVCQLTHKTPLSSLVCQLTHKTLCLFSGMPAYTQNPLSSLVCQLTHKTLSLFCLVQLSSPLFFFFFTGG